MTGPLRPPGAILLVSCYELGHQPLGTALPAAFLERRGFAPTQLDLSQQPLAAEPVQAARFIAISVPMHTALRLGVQAARRIRALNPAAFVCFHGLYAWLNAAYLREELADAVLGGEIEETLAGLVEALDCGETPAPPASPVLRRLSFVAPSRAGLPALPRYAHLVSARGEEVPAGYVEASRGCLHRCLHCPIPAVYGGRFFVVPQDIVLEDIRRLVAAGARHISFGDPDFLNGPGHSLRVVRAMHTEFPELSFDFTAKVEHILERRELLAELAALGCLFLVTAVESLSNRVLRYLEKGHTRADVYEALGVTRGAGITLRPTFIPFTPWSTLDDYVQLVEFVEGEDLVNQVDPVQLTIRLLVPPGSVLAAKPWMQEHMGALDRAAFTYRWVHPDPRMDRLHRVVHRIVERAAKRGEEAARTFARIRATALLVRDGRRPPRRRPLRVGAPTRAPRLTEPWFC